MLRIDRKAPTLALVVVAIGCRTSGQGSTELCECPTEPAATSTEPGAAAELEELTELYEQAQGRSERLVPLQGRLEQFLATDPDNPQALMLLAQVLLEREELEDSLLAAKRCTFVSPDESGCWLVIAVINEARSSYATALEAYRNYVRLAPEGRYAKDARKGIARCEGKTGTTGETGATSKTGETSLDAATTTAKLESTMSSTVRASVEMRMFELGRCHRRALATHPNLQGMMTLELGVDPKGDVVSTRIIEDTVGSDDVKACVRGRVDGWSFGPQPDSGEVRFSVRFDPE